MKRKATTGRKTNGHHDSIIHDVNVNDNDSGIVASINGYTYNMIDESYAIRLASVEAEKEYLSVTYRT